MVAIPVQEYIKHLYEKEERSIREIAEATGVSWRTAAKYSKRSDWNEPDGRRRRRRPVMDDYADIVDTWLLEDRLQERKDRRNAAKIYRDLERLHGFKGSARTVREYVNQRKQELFKGEPETYVSLEHEPGEAQVDFGTVHVVEDGKKVEIRTLVISFPYSNAGFAYPLPSENRECFLEGLKRLFERIGGVPQRIVFDNLTAAVIKVGQGEDRVVHDMFRRFALHYRFEYAFCGPGKGNEKGNVENKVGYHRRHWLTPIQPLEGFESLAERLWKEAVGDLERLHYKKGATLATLWETEKHSSLFALPTVPFEVSRFDQAVINKYGQIQWEKGTYDVPQGQPGTEVLLTVYWNRIDVRDRNQDLLTTVNRQYMLKREAIDWAAHFRIYAKRPRAVVSASLFCHLPLSVQEFVRDVQPELRSQRVRLLRDVLERYSMEQVAKALETLPANRQDDRASLEHKLYALDPNNAPLAPVPDSFTPLELVGYEPEMSQYDRLAPNYRKGMTI